MTGEWKIEEWNACPEPSKKLQNGSVLVTRNVEAVEITDEVDGEPRASTIWRGESCRMSEAAYSAYAAMQEIVLKHEEEIVDKTIIQLIEEGSL